MIAIPARSSASLSLLRDSTAAEGRGLVEAVWAAGGEPVVLHRPAPAGAVEDAEVAGRLQIADGVLLPCGGDLAEVDLEQDAFDLAAARLALATGTPLLAICHGAQVVNVARGGTVAQDVVCAGGELMHHRHRRHVVQVDESSLLGQVVGSTVHASCYHHQRVDTLGDGLKVAARAEDGVVEAVELAAARGWFVGVQWHPEDTWSEDPQQLAVFRALVAAARGDRALRGVG